MKSIFYKQVSLSKLGNHDCSYPVDIFMIFVLEKISEGNFKIAKGSNVRRRRTTTTLEPRG